MRHAKPPVAFTDWLALQDPADQYHDLLAYVMRVSPAMYERWKDLQETAWRNETHQPKEDDEPTTASAVQDNL